ncbi:hypothetical protein LTS18_014777 [Coniosporium uncinatum]|uniref:Uncharacterized protein n=1 Tax=Coniosporium uncinatum TaxID=93489 RepID=A0ACC3DH07_9PEZI|nr:hypothetical protein LTS18_014777 [Coniosporium uncinatum]
MDRSAVFRIGPWYSQIQLLMQALSILMLELSFQCEHMKKGDTNDIKRNIKKLIATLRMLSVNHRPAERAWRMALEIMEKAAPSLNFDMSDVKRYPPTGVSPTSTPAPASASSSRATHWTDGIPNFAPPPSNTAFADQTEDDVMSAAQPFYNPFSQPMQQQQSYSTQGVPFDPFIIPSSASSGSGHYGFNTQHGTSGMDTSYMGLSTAYDQFGFMSLDSSQPADGGGMQAWASDGGGGMQDGWGSWGMGGVGGR